MLNYKDVVKPDNNGKVFLCKVDKGGFIQELELQVHWDGEHHTQLYDYTDQDDFNEFTEHMVLEIISEVAVEDYEDDEPDVDNIMWKELEEFYMVDDNVFSYSNKQELDEIIKMLDSPIISDTGYENNYDHLFKHEYGLVFCWSECDDFSCYGDGFTHHIKVISGVKKV